MAYKPTNSEHVNRYMKKAYDRISVFVPKGRLDVYKRYAAEHGMSVNALFGVAVNALLLENGVDVLEECNDRDHVQN